MPYAAVEQLKRDHLTTIKDTADDGALGRFLAVATLIIDHELGYSFTAATPGSEVVYGDGTTVLKLPASYVADSLTGVTTTSGYTVPDDYVELDGRLIVATADGGLLTGYRTRWPYHYDPFVTGGLWTDGAPYTIAGNFGHGDAPEDIKWLNCEFAVMLWKFRDAGGSEVVSTEAAVQVVRANWNDNHRAVLAAYTPDKPIGVF